MIGIDSNVLVRYIAQDDAKQSARATTVIERECSAAVPGFVGVVVLAEVVWVSESCYAATRQEVAAIVRRILGSKQLVVQHADTAWQALRTFESGNGDFADCLIACAATAAGCDRVLSFDRKAAGAGMTLLK